MENRLTPAAAALIRLHVVGADDSDAAQSRKLMARDAILSTARALVSGAADADAAWRSLQGNSRILEKAASHVEKCAVSCGIETFPDRDYGGIVVPAGEYRAVKVVLGAGKGHNWWCVLYPTLCLPAEDGFYSILQTWWQHWFGGGAV